MFEQTPIMFSFSVKNLDEAKKFYNELLGLKVTTGEMGTLMFHPKVGGLLMVYAKDDHKPATYTVLNFLVDDIDSYVDDLAAKGVEFKHYGEGFFQDEKGIARGKEHNMGPNIAWFEDPSGNVLAIIEEDKK
jgi:catechol 2,3-dioxygenase-like lactoylglutathione lyase family enzyme